MIPIPHDPMATAGGPSLGGGMARPCWQSGDKVEGWVTAEITPYPRPLRSLTAPYEAQFVLAVVEYPSGPATKWGGLRWRSVDVVLRSDHAWPVTLGGDDAPQLTPDLQKYVDELAQLARAGGWEPAGRGRTWCSLRFRRRCEQLDGRLMWR